MKVLLIHPNFHCGGAELAIGTMTPLGLLYLGGILIDNGHVVKLLDAAKLNMGTGHLRENIEIFKPDVVCVGSSASIVTSKKSLEVIKIVKEIDTKIKTIYGGSYPTFQFDKIMKNYSQVDFIIQGEGELTIEELVNALENQKPLDRINGLIWRKNGGSYLVNDLRKPIEDLDSVRPAWELIDWELYRNGTTKEITAVVQFSRGCPSSCDFCGQWGFWRKYKVRDPIKFVDELEYLNKKYNVTYFFFADENPGVSPTRWLNVLNEIIRRNLDIHIILNLKVTDVIRDANYLSLYKKAGIVHVDLGVEGVEQEYLDQINKRTTVTENRKAIKLLRKNGIATSANLFFGDRNETKERLKRKFRIIRDWDPDFVITYIPIPIPWTRLHKDTKKEWIRTFDCEKWDYVTPIIIPENYDSNEMINDIIKESFKFVFHPMKILSIVLGKDRYKRKFTLAYIYDGLLHFIFYKYASSRYLVKLLHDKFHGKNKQPLFPLFGRELVE